MRSLCDKFGTSSDIRAPRRADRLSGANRTTFYTGCQYLRYAFVLAAIESQFDNAAARRSGAAGRYPRCVLSIQRLRERLPLVVYILLFILLLMLVGLACACATDHPMQSAERAVSSISAVPALIEVWAYTFAALLVVAFVVTQQRRPLGRASPADLQRFLF